MSLIQNMMGILLEICIFFQYSAKRECLLEENITHIYVRLNALRVFILEIRLDIYEDKKWNSESITKANGL